MGEKKKLASSVKQTNYKVVTFSLTEQHQEEHVYKKEKKKEHVFLLL